MTHSVRLFIGIDDTDLIDTPGTNKLAQHIAVNLGSLGYCNLITRHQLLQDPRVPCTNKNGCACLQINTSSDSDRMVLIAFLRQTILDWAPLGSDPGLCVACENTAPEVSTFGLLCQSEIVTQAGAQALAMQLGIYLEGLGGTRDGLIGALAAVGLASSGNSGRVIYSGKSGIDAFGVSGTLSIQELLDRGVDNIRTLDGRHEITVGSVDVGKRVRPNLRDNKVVLYVERSETKEHWLAKKLF
jgi:hypothetical protein